MFSGCLNFLFVTGPSNTLCSCRYIVSYLVFLGFTCAFMNRVNISVAMTAMANSTYSSTYDTVNSTAELCPERSNETEETIRAGSHGIAHTQEQILALFYYGFPFFQIPAGLLADRYPIFAPIIGVGYLISSISNLFIPGAFNGGAPAIMALRIISGLAEPVFTQEKTGIRVVILAKHSPPILATFRIRLPGVGPSYIYLFGSLGILWYIPWVLLVYHSPTVHPRISQEERDYIVTQLNLTDGPPKTPKYPWKDFLTSMPLFAVCATDFALLWVLYSLTANLPIFLKEALRFDISQSGILASVPHIVFFFFIMGGGFLADFLLTHTKLSLTAVRKIMTTLGLVPSGAFLVLAGYVGCNATLVLIFISLGLATTGLAYSGASLTMMEFAPAYAGMVVAIANSVATIPGFVAPIVVAIYTENQADLGGWRTFFWISFGICMAAWVIFMIFGTSELQSWAKVVDDEDGIDSKSYTNGRAIESTDFRCSTDKSL
eukprot:XP_011664744.1 PREDICTED: vesicular glutamate transporter 3 [Strongylocentrotus purpuratus]